MPSLTKLIGCPTCFIYFLHVEFLQTFMPVLHQLGAIYRFSGIPAGIDREALTSILFNAGLKVSKMEFFSNERSANVIIADANPTTQDVARKALNGRCNIDFIRANTHADVNGFGSVTSQVEIEMDTTKGQTGKASVGIDD